MLCNYVEILSIYEYNLITIDVNITAPFVDCSSVKSKFPKHSKLCLPSSDGFNKSSNKTIQCYTNKESTELPKIKGFINFGNSDKH